MKARASVVIVGGGVSGLAAAWELSGGREGPNPETPRIEIIESAATMGGELRTATFAGREIDCGADGFLARRPEVVTLVDEMDWHDQLVPVASSGAWLWLGGRLSPLPAGLVLGVPTSTKSLRTLSGLSGRARRAAWRDEHLPRRMTVLSDATIGHIVRSKLGDDLAYQLVEPMIGGIQAGRIDELSAASVFPALLDAAKSGGSLMKALRPPVATEAAAVSALSPIFCTLRHGVGSLATELASRLAQRGVVMTTKTSVTALRRTWPSFYQFEVDTATTTTPANSVVVATPPQVASRLLNGFDPAFAQLGTVESASCAMITFEVPTSAVSLPPTGTGILVPLGSPFRGGETLMVTAITLLDRKWPHLCVDGTVVVRAHVGRSDDDRLADLDDVTLVKRLRDELTTILGRWPTDGDSMVVRWPDGLPQYRVGHGELVANARAAADELGVALAGNTYDGVGIPASVGSGRRAGRAVRTILAER